MSLRGYISVEAEVEVAVSDLVDRLSDEDIEQLYREQQSGSRAGDLSQQEMARRLARSIEIGDGKTAADYAHRLCMDLAGVPVLRPIAIGPAPWERSAA
jgi:hypothetical protein